MCHSVSAREGSSVMDESDLPVVEMIRPRWGNPETPGHLPPVAEQALGALGVGGPRPAVPADQIEVPVSTLTDDARRAIARVVGGEHLTIDPVVRAQHTR